MEDAATAVTQAQNLADDQAVGVAAARYSN
jgi:hypothetical protein